MKNRISKYNKIFQETTEIIKLDLVDYFRNVDFWGDNKNIQIVNISDINDLKRVYAGRGFYIILTDYHFKGNTCEFVIDTDTAIYRGHSYTVRKRITSHLFNDIYKKKRKSYEPDYNACLKIDDGKNGININKQPYEDWNWTVIVQKMRNSNKEIREQAEKAFDIVYGKPLKCRDK